MSGVISSLKGGEGCVRMGEGNRADQEDNGGPIIGMEGWRVVVDEGSPVSGDFQGRVMS